MKYEITSRTDTTVTFKIEASETELKHALAHAHDKYRGQVKVSGFRPGKAPDHIVAREVGENTIQSETVEHAVSHAYSDAVFQEKLAVIAQPEIAIRKFVPYTELEFQATVEIVPPVKLADYKKIKKAEKPVEVDAKQVDEVIEDLRRRVAKRVPAAAAAEIDNEVKFDFEGKKDGEPVSGAAGKGYTLKLGSGTFIPGFEEELVGLKPGEEKTFTVTFPQDYQEQSLAGQPVEFTVKMLEVTELQLPEVTDAFASEVGPFKTVAALRKDITSQLEAEAADKAKREYENELLEEIVAKSDIKVPEKLVDQQLARMKADMEQRLSASGISLQQYLQIQNQTEGQMDVELRPEAEKRVKLALVLSEVSRAENLTVGEDEIEDEIGKMRQQYQDPKIQEELNHDRVKEDIYNHLMAGKVINALIGYAKE